MCIYIPHISPSSHGGFTLIFQFLWYEVGRQHVKALQAAAISPYLTSPTPPIPLQRTATTPGTSCPTLFD